MATTRDTKLEEDARIKLAAMAEVVANIRLNYQQIIQKRLNVPFFRKDNHIDDAVALRTTINTINNAVQLNKLNPVEGYTQAIEAVGKVFAKGADKKTQETKNQFAVTLNKEEKKHHFYRMIGSLLKVVLVSAEPNINEKSNVEAAFKKVDDGRDKSVLGGNAAPITEELRTLKIPNEFALLLRNTSFASTSQEKSKPERP